MVTTKPTPSYLAANFTYLLRQSGMKQKEFAYACFEIDRPAYVAEIKSGKLRPSPELRALIVEYCNKKYYPFRIKDEHLDEPTELLVRRLTGAMPPQCIPIPTPIVDSWKNQPTLFHRATNLNNRKLKDNERRPPGRFILYFFSKAHQEIVGCNFSITRHDENGIHFCFVDGNDGKLTSSFVGVLYQIGSYTYFFAWPESDTTELVLGILEFGRTIAVDGASGHLIGIQHADGTGDNTATHMFPTPVRLLPLSHGRLSDVEYPDDGSLDRYARTQTGVLPGEAAHADARRFFKDELSRRVPRT